MVAPSGFPIVQEKGGLLDENTPLEFDVQVRFSHRLHSSDTKRRCTHLCRCSAPPSHSTSRAPTRSKRPLVVMCCLATLFGRRVTLPGRFRTTHVDSRCA